EVLDTVAFRGRTNALDNLWFLREHRRLPKVIDHRLIPVEACELCADGRQRDRRFGMACDDPRERLQKGGLIRRRHRCVTDERDEVAKVVETHRRLSSII